MSEKMPTHRDYWNSFYASRASSEVPAEPSAFATWVADRLGSNQTVVEFGFGNARDSLWFARQGRRVVGYDFAGSAVDAARSDGDRQGLSTAFHELDLYDDSATRLIGKKIASEITEPAIYGRFLVHSLEAAGRRNLLDLAATALHLGGQIYLEFRTGRDRDAKHLFGDDHFRQYLDPALVESELDERGATISHSEAGHGLAIYRTEDPHVARIVARWNGVEGL